MASTGPRRVFARTLSIGVAAVVTLAACASPKPPASPTPIAAVTLAPLPTPTQAPIATFTPAPIPAALSADEYAIYDVIINPNPPSQFQAQGEIVIEADTTNRYNPSDRATDIRGYVARQMTGLQPQTIDSFLAANQTMTPLADQFHLNGRIVLLSRADQAKIFSGDWQTMWTTFYQRFPGASGLRAFSRVGFNSARDQALVYYQISSGSLDAEGSMILLKKTSTGWLVQQQLQLWIA